MIKMKKTTLIISALLALNVSQNANSETEKSTPAPVTETAPAAPSAPAPVVEAPLATPPAATDVKSDNWGIDTKNIAKDIQPVTIFTAMSIKAGWIR